MHTPNGFRLEDGTIDNSQCPHLHTINRDGRLICQTCAKDFGVEATNRLRGSKDEIAHLLSEFDLIGTTLPIWAIRLINGLRHELEGSQAESR